MAVARSAASLVSSRDAEYAEIERWYRDLLGDTLPPTDLEWEPVKIGPTWIWDNGWKLPDATLGWGFLSWCGYWLTGKGRKPWQFTAEQARFLLWFFAVDDHADFIFHSAMLQRLKGWGKDPVGSTVAAGSLHAPIMFDHWVGDRPVGRDDPDAWTQVCAVAQDQTKNTMKLFPSLFSPEAIREYGIQIGKLNVWSDGDRRQIEAVTSSPAVIEGGRAHLIIRNEIQNWNRSNGGHDMAGAIEGNAAKSEIRSPARILDIFNAYRPGEDSVAERARVGWEEAQGDDAIRLDYGVLLDSLEAPPNAPLTPDAAPAVVRSIAGDSTWLDTRPNGRIVKSILNPANSAAESRRKWYNQITGTDDAWIEPRWADQCVDRGLVLADGDRIAMFGDGSKSRDDTGLVACRVSDGALFVLHHQHPVADQIVRRADLDAAVDEAMERYAVSAFWFDPSHAKDDSSSDDDRFWWPLVDDWHSRYGRRLKLWPVQSGPNRHSVAFDMLSPTAQKLFQPAVSQLADDLKADEVRIAPSAVLLRHMKNARRREGRFGLSVGKENRSSARKIDLAVCAIGARMLRRQLLVTNTAGSPGRGRVIGLG